MFKLEKHVQIPEMGTKMAEILRHFTENGRSNFAMINLSEIIIPNNLSEKHSKNQLNVTRITQVFSSGLAETNPTAEKILLQCRNISEV